MKPSNEFCVAFLKASGWLDNHDAEIKAETINNPHRIKEFDCPYAVTKCETCDWNYANTCNFDFNSYQQGVIDTINKFVAMHNKCNTDLCDKVGQGISCCECIAEKLKENADER